MPLRAALLFLTGPPAPFLPPELHGAPLVALAALYAGDATKGAEALRALRHLQPPAVDLFGELPYTALQSMFDETAPAGLQNYWKSSAFADLDDAMAATLVSRATALTSPLSHIDVHHLGGAVRRLSDDATAYPLRGADYVVNIVGTWTDPGDSPAHIASVRDAWEALRPGAVTASYVNFLADTGRDVVEAAYGPRIYTRLSQVKRTYDPDNVFRTNHNVAPSAQTSSA